MLLQLLPLHCVSLVSQNSSPCIVIILNCPSQTGVFTAVTYGFAALFHLRCSSLSQLLSAVDAFCCNAHHFASRLSIPSNSCRFLCHFAVLSILRCNVPFFTSFCSPLFVPRAGPYVFSFTTGPYVSCNTPPRRLLSSTFLHHRHSPTVYYFVLAAVFHPFSLNLSTLAPALHRISFSSVYFHSLCLHKRSTSITHKTSGKNLLCF